MKRLHKKLLKTGENRYLVVVEHNGKDRLFFMDTHTQAVEDRWLCGYDMSFETHTMNGKYGYGIRFKNDNDELCFECVDDTGLQHPAFSEVSYLDGPCMCKVRQRETRKYGLAAVSSGKLLHPFEYDGFMEERINVGSFLYGFAGDEKVTLWTPQMGGEGRSISVLSPPSEEKPPRKIDEIEGIGTVYRAHDRDFIVDSSGRELFTTGEQFHFYYKPYLGDGYWAVDSQKNKVGILDRDFNVVLQARMYDSVDYCGNSTFILSAWNSNYDVLYVVEKNKGYVKLKKASISNTKFGYLICKDDEENLMQYFNHEHNPRSLYDKHGNRLAGERSFYDIVEVSEHKVFCVAGDNEYSELVDVHSGEHLPVKIILGDGSEEDFFAEK